MIANWNCPGTDGPSEEWALAIDRQRLHRVLIVPPMFEELNRTRRFMASTMRLLDAHGIDTFLPDLPGCNESTQPLAAQSLQAWRTAMAVAARQFEATHVLAVRGGVLVFPNSLPGWVVEPIMGGTILRQMLRARVIAAREEGRTERSARLIETGRRDGIELAGYHLAPSLIAGLEAARPLDEGQREIRMADLGGHALWLRSEPGEDADQSARLAAIIARDIAA